MSHNTLFSIESSVFNSMLMQKYDREKGKRKGQRRSLAKGEINEKGKGKGNPQL